MNTRIDQLLIKDDYRKWLICKAIDQIKVVTIEYLMKICACTSKTVLADIQKINDQYSSINNMPILKKKRGHIYIEFDQAMPLTTIYRKILTQSIPFKLLKELIEDREMTLSKFSQRHYVSYNPIYRAIEKLNTYLAPFSLSIMKFKLAGEEYKIRIFLLHFYWDIFGGGAWPFEIIDKRQCKEVVDKLEHTFFTNVTWIEYEKLCFWVAIVKIRERLIHEEVALEPPTYWQHLSLEKYNEIKKANEKLSLKEIGKGTSFILVALFLICGRDRLKNNRIDLTSFNDSVSVVSENLILRLKKNRRKKPINDCQIAQNELIKLIHYNQLGESYTALALKLEYKNGNFIDRNLFPELDLISTEQAFQILQILKVQNIINMPCYSIYIATKYDDSVMRKIKAIMEDASPKNFRYSSLWNTSGQANVILTDIEKMPKNVKGLQLYFCYPFNEKKASEFVGEIKCYFNLIGENWIDVQQEMPENWVSGVPVVAERNVPSRNGQ